MIDIVFLLLAAAYIVSATIIIPAAFQYGIILGLLFDVVARPYFRLHNSYGPRSSLTTNI